MLAAQNLDLLSGVDSKLYKVIRGIEHRARAERLSVYIVGGILRDALLGLRPFAGGVPAELDLMISDGLDSFLRGLQRDWGKLFGDFAAPVDLVIFPKYLTAKLVFEEPIVLNRRSIDFSAARREIYLQPGAAPSVERGDLTSDMLRRDFSINALALELNEPTGDRLWDYCEGLVDLDARLIRVLHARSFTDDPARLIRATRLMVRLDLRLENETAALFQEAVLTRALESLTIGRLYSELKKVLREHKAIEILEQLMRRGVLNQILPGANFEALQLAMLANPDVSESDAQHEVDGLTSDELRLVSALFSKVSDEHCRNALKRIATPRRVIARIMEYKRDMH